MGLFTLVGATVATAESLLSGSVVGRHIYGLATDVNGDPLLIEEKPLIYSSSNFDVRLPMNDDQEAVISGFGDILGGLYLSQYQTRTGKYIDSRSFALKGVEGLSAPQGGAVTAWGTVLFGESALVDAAKPDNFIKEFKPFYKGKPELVKPYNYGWLGEAILLDDRGAAKVIKDYAVGRVAPSRIFMMPDGETLYLFDKENSGHLYLYRSDDKNSLTKGSLYGVSVDDGRIHYQLLANSSALKVKFKLKKISFRDIYNTAIPDNGQCPKGFTYVATFYGEECLKQNRKARKYAGIFEPIRTAAFKRKGRPLTRFSDVNFQMDDLQVLLAVNGKSSRSYTLGGVEKMGSHYIIQESQQ